MAYPFVSSQQTVAQQQAPCNLAGYLGQSSYGPNMLSNIAGANIGYINSIPIKKYSFLEMLRNEIREWHGDLREI